MYQHWTTAKGEKIPLPCLSDSHLMNIIKMLRCKWDNTYIYACEHQNDNVTIASASDCMPGPDYDLFEPPELKPLIALARARGLNV